MMFAPADGFLVAIILFLWSLFLLRYRHLSRKMLPPGNAAHQGSETSEFTPSRAPGTRTLLMTVIGMNPHS